MFQDENIVLCLQSGDCPINIFHPNGTNGFLVWIIIKELVELEVSQEDGLPPTICRKCMKKLTDFKYFKEMCINSRIEFFKFQLNQGLIVSVKVEEREIDEPRENELSSCGDEGSEDEAQETEEGSESEEGNEGGVDTDREPAVDAEKQDNCRTFEMKGLGTLKRLRRSTRLQRTTETQDSHHILSGESESTVEEGEKQKRMKDVSKSSNLLEMDTDSCEEIQKRSAITVGGVNGKHARGKKLICKVSSKGLSGKNKVMDHTTIHSGFHHRCDICDKGFAENGHLKAHTASAHLKQGEFLCNFCSKAYGRKLGLRSHIYSHSNFRSHMKTHTGEKTYSCSECHMKFRDNDKLRQHIVIHTGEKPHSCTKCSKSYTQNANLWRHINNFHMGKRPHSCPKCPKTFGVKSHLNQHMMVHTRLKPFKCTHCFHKCNIKSNLRRHIATVHRVEDNASD